MDLFLILGAFSVATVVAWLVAAFNGRIAWHNVARGLVNGVVVAAVLAGLAAAGTLLVYRASEPPMQVVLLLVPTVIGLGYLWLGTALMPIGFMFGGGSDWARYGTWAAVVVIVFSLGMGAIAYNAFQERPGQPATSPSPSAEIRSVSLGRPPSA